MKKEGAILIYDKDFDLVMKEEETLDLSEYKIMKINDKKFIMTNEKELSLWDLDNENKTEINLPITELAPNLVELMENKTLLIAYSWIQSYDLYEFLK